MDLLPDSPSDSWPDTHTALYCHALPPALCAALAEDAVNIAKAPNYWVPRDVLESGDPTQLRWESSAPFSSRVDCARLASPEAAS